MPDAAAIGVEPPGPFFEGHWFQTERLMASHGLAGVFPQETLELADRDTVGYQYLLDIAYETATDPTILGLAWHLLYIARRQHLSGDACESRSPGTQTWNERPRGRSFESLRTG